MNTYIIHIYLYIYNITESSKRNRNHPIQPNFIQCCAVLAFFSSLLRLHLSPGPKHRDALVYHRLQLDAAVACGEWRHACQLEAVVRGAGGGYHLRDLPREDLWPLSGGFLPCFHRFWSFIFVFFPKVG